MVMPICICALEPRRSLILTVLSMNVVVTVQPRMKHVRLERLVKLRPFMLPSMHTVPTLTLPLSATSIALVVAACQLVLIAVLILNVAQAAAEEDLAFEPASKNCVAVLDYLSKLEPREVPLPIFISCMFSSASWGCWRPRDSYTLINNTCDS
jgi:hypothetical protein